MTNKVALITGITGQDGSYLAEFLLSKNYEVHGIIRCASTFNTERLDSIYVDPHIPGAKLFLHYGDLSDACLLTNLIYEIKPNEVYHLGAQSHVRVSFDTPLYTSNITALGTTRLLEAIKKSGYQIKFYQASSSEMFGSTPPPQNEISRFSPQSPYATAKLYSYWIAINYREGYNMFVSNGILFNHESPRRGKTFVTRKITRAIANIIANKQEKLYLGNLDARRDWGFAPEYVTCQWLILQQEKPDDYVIGTGQSHSVKDFVEEAFDYVGIDIEWIGKDENTKGLVRSVSEDFPHIKNGDILVEIDPRYFRPNEVVSLVADYSKAKNFLKWEPQVKFDELVQIMMNADMKEIGMSRFCRSEDILQNKNFNWIKGR